MSNYETARLSQPRSSTLGENGNRPGTLGKTQSQYERKLARQKQLDLMEAAASGSNLNLGDSFGSIDSTGAGSHKSSERIMASLSPKSNKANGIGNVPEGAIESARRFLWDEEEDGHDNNRRHLSHYPTNTNGTDFHNQQHVNLMASYGDLENTNNNHDSGIHEAPPKPQSLGARLMSKVMGGSSAAAARDLRTNWSDVPESSSSRSGRFSGTTRKKEGWMGEAQPTESEEYTMRDIRVNSSRSLASGGGIRPPARSSNSIFDICLYLYHQLLDCASWFMEYLSAWIGYCNLRLFSIICGAVVGLGLFLFAIAALAQRGNSNDDASTNAASSSLESIKDEVRYQSLRHVILESAFTSPPELDTDGTAQNLALRWLTDDDPAILETDDDAMLQRYALATFYFSTFVATEIQDRVNVYRQQDPNFKGGQWTNTQHWMSEKGICLWYGITCPPHLKEGVEETHYNENSDVIRLNLTANNIRGTLPSELAALENMVSLDLGKNKLEGTIPPSFASFELLKELYLEDNRLAGRLPSELANVDTLRDIFIGTNRFTGTIPPEWGKEMSNLRALGLDENLLTGRLPATLFTLSNLMIFYVDDNKLTGTLPTQIAQLTELIDLRLRRNNLGGTLPTEIDHLSHLELFYVDDNNMTGPIPDVWDKMRRVQEIQVYKNDFTGTLPNTLATLRDLRVLYADSNQFEGSLPPSYGTLGDLNTFYAFGNKLQGSIPSEYGQMQDLKDFQVNNNALTGTIPVELASCYKLETLVLNSNAGISGTLPEQFGKLETLQILKVHETALKGKVPDKVCDAKNNFLLRFISADCNTEKGGTLECSCCDSCTPAGE